MTTKQALPNQKRKKKTSDIQSAWWRIRCYFRRQGQSTSSQDFRLDEYAADLDSNELERLMTQKTVDLPNLTGAGLICLERIRQEQIDLGISVKYPGDLSVVAAMLAVEDTDAHVDDPCGRDCSSIMRDYPGRVERLVIAGAILAAEIDLIRGGGKQ